MKKLLLFYNNKKKNTLKIKQGALHTIRPPQGRISSLVPGTPAKLLVRQSAGNLFGEVCASLFICVIKRNNRQINPSHKKQANFVLNKKHTLKTVASQVCKTEVWLLPRPSWERMKEINIELYQDLTQVLLEEMAEDSVG